MVEAKKTVLVTGAASGIGRAACERLARNGWNVLAVDRDADTLRWTSAAGIASVVADIALEEDNQRMVNEAERLFGGLHAAVLNAAVTGGGGIEAMSFSAYRKVIDVNLFGAVLGIRAVLPSLPPHKAREAIPKTGPMRPASTRCSGWFEALRVKSVGKVSVSKCAVSGPDRNGHDERTQAGRAGPLRVTAKSGPTATLGHTGRNGVGARVSHFPGIVLCERPRAGR